MRVAFKMHIPCTLGAILFIFILCVHCDNAANYNEFERIYVPSAPKNLKANRIESETIQLTWEPPTYYNLHDDPNRPDFKPDPNKPDVQADAPIVSQETPDFQASYWYDSDKKYNEDYASDINDSLRSKRDLRYAHRHRKRRQENSTDAKTEHTIMKEVVKKSSPDKHHKGLSQVAYVLYFEQGLPRTDAKNVSGVPSQEDVKRKNVFPSDLGMSDYQKGARNLTLLNTAGKLAKVVGFRLRNLTSFTPYKIWVRAFHNFSLDGVKSSDLLARLGPPSEPLYVLTEVRPPSAPMVLNLTCDQASGRLFLQWRQPLLFDNTLDQYVVTLRKIPELQPRTRLTLPTSSQEIETTISVVVELWNLTVYEVKIYAVTLSVARSPPALVNGTESAPEEISSEWCSAHSESRASNSDDSGSSVALLAALPIALLAALTVAAVYCRCRSRVSKCISAAYNYLEEGGERAARAPLHSYKKTAAPAAAAPPPAVTSRPPRISAPQHPALSRRAYVEHVSALHRDSDLGFSKEYEIVVSKSAALAHTSHHSHRPENRLKNRYLNITAYDHSRVCVSAGGRCGALGCVGGAAAHVSACDYVNANFIDGMLPALDAERVKYIKRKLENRNRPSRQPSTRPAKPPPNLTEGIESAFLNIEFSGIVDSAENSDDSDSDSEQPQLDQVYVDIDNTPTRVKLEWLVWRRRYIATQGPTPATLGSFWRMIWQHNVTTVVMITNLVERGRRKCDMYWPGGGLGSTAEHGGIRVTLLHEDVRALYTVRHMRAVKIASPGAASDTQPRTLTQYHYTVWPDHGTPRHPLAVLPFVRAAAADSNTVLVHCSAGVGRTGTYIVLDAQLNQLKLTGTLSPLGFLCRARTQRNHLVQTEEQYIFVHDALLEHVRSGNTEVEFCNAKEYLIQLLQPISEDELAVLDVTPNKNKSVNDLTNGYDHETSSQANESIDKTGELTNGNGSQMSLKTDDLTDQSQSKSSKSSVKEINGDIVENGDHADGTEEGAETEGEKGGEETEGVYDLAPRNTDTYSNKMQAYNNMSEQEKEEIRRANRAENYAILERMRSLSSRNQEYQGPPPCNLLEKQHLLISRSCVEPLVCARAPHNADKNRPGAALPSDAARVMLVPKPGVEGSEYVNASWVCGRRRLREFAVAQHPPPPVAAAADLWRLLWDHTAQLVLLLSEPDCESFWPTEDEKELFVANFRASFISKDTFVAHRKCDRPPATPAPEMNGHARRHGSGSAESGGSGDDERLIPETESPVLDNEPAYRFDRTELRLERLSTGNRDLSARKSIANGDLFSSLSESRKNPKSPRSPSKMSLKNFKLNSPTKLKFPEWVSPGSGGGGGGSAGAPPCGAPPPPPVAPALSREEEAELHRPCYYFEKVDTVPADIPSDRVIEVTNVSVHSLQDDYQLSVKFIRCCGWLDGPTTSYTVGKPDENELVQAVRGPSDGRTEAAERLMAPYRDSFALVEFVAGCQMEYKNGPVVVVDKFGSSRAMSLCTLSAACGGARPASAARAQYAGAGDDAADLYRWAAVNAPARCNMQNTVSSLLAMYAATANYGELLSKS